jgi:EAL domain-containing protein (putative c-di-GMP-specific phosphodiesterase class I)
VAHVQRRARLFVAASTLAVLLAVASAAYVTTGLLGGFAAHMADNSAKSGVDLLTRVGPHLPPLTQATFRAGFTAPQTHRIDMAVDRGRKDGLISGLLIWDEHGSVLYAGDHVLQGERIAIEPELLKVLSGTAVTRRHPEELDRSYGRNTGVLDAFEPLEDKAGHVYGAVEMVLPLHPIAASTSAIQWRLGLILIGGAFVLWLLALPFVLRASRLAALHWVPGRRRLLRAFEAGLARGEIEMAYQPQVDPTLGTVHAVEALVRWRRNGELQPPDSFLSIVEDSPLMARLTDRVLDLALAELCRCDDAGHCLRMSVNCSATDLADQDFPERVRAALDLWGIPGWRLTLEVTETAILEDPAAAQTVLTAVTDLGVEIAVDDFGTGHASIARLHALPVNELKIDRSFMSGDDRSRSYVAAIASFGRALGLRVVAEGVEDRSTLLLLKGAGCDLAQGYVISRPLDGEALRAWLAMCGTDPAPKPEPEALAV